MGGATVRWAPGKEGWRLAGAAAISVRPMGGLRFALGLSEDLVRYSVSLIVPFYMVLGFSLYLHMPVTTSPQLSTVSVTIVCVRVFVSNFFVVCSRVRPVLG